MRLSDDQSSQLCQVVAEAYPIASRFNSMAWMHFIFFKNQPSTQIYMRQVCNFR